MKCTTHYEDLSRYGLHLLPLHRHSVVVMTVESEAKIPLRCHTMANVTSSSRIFAHPTVLPVTTDMLELSPSHRLNIDPRHGTTMPFLPEHRETSQELQGVPFKSLRKAWWRGKWELVHVRHLLISRSGSSWVQMPSRQPEPEPKMTDGHTCYPRSPSLTLRQTSQPAGVRFLPWAR